MAQMRPSGNLWLLLLTQRPPPWNKPTWKLGQDKQVERAITRPRGRSWMWGLFECQALPPHLNLGSCSENIKVRGCLACYCFQLCKMERSDIRNSGWCILSKGGTYLEGDLGIMATWPLYAALQPRSKQTGSACCHSSGKRCLQLVNHSQPQNHQHGIHRTRRP